MSSFLCKLSYLALTLAIFSAEAKVAGHLIYSKGSVSFGKTGGKYTRLKRKSSFREGDLIKTGPSSLAILKLLDGSKIKLSANSNIKIRRLKNRSGTKDTSIYIRYGSAFFNILKSKRKKPHFTVRSRLISMGVRGTTFFARVQKRNSQDSISMCVQKGSVLVQNVKRKKPVLVRAGLGVKIKNGISIPKPQAFPWIKKLNWNFNPRKTLHAGQNPNKLYSQDLLGIDYD